MIRVDKERGILVVRKGSVVTKNLKFDGRVIAGMNCSFLGSIEAEEIRLSRGCVVAGYMKCRRAVIGARSEFNVIQAEDVIVLRGCKGGSIFASGEVRVASKCSLDEVRAGRILIEGDSRIGKMDARKIIAVSEF